MRRIVYVIAGILAVNLAVMVGLWVRMQDDPCDPTARGLVVDDEQRDKWRRVLPSRDPDPAQGPCRGRYELKVWPGEDTG